MTAKVYVVRIDAKYWVLRWKDVVTGRWREKSAKTGDKRQADKAAAQLEADLQEGRYAAPSRLAWDEFRERYEQEKLPSLAVKSRKSAGSALNHVEELMRPTRLVELDAAWLSRFQARLRATGIKETSIATHLRQLRAALSWARAVGLLVKMPEVHMPKRAKGKTAMRGRPITAEEFERMLAAVDAVRPHDASGWKHYLTGLWLSGLRLRESLLLGWDEESPIAVDLAGGRRPKLRIYAEAEKGHQDRLLPMTPDFAEWLAKVPLQERHGRVFKLLSGSTGMAMSVGKVGHVVSAVGKKAGVVVNKADGKFASAHDLRRAFGTRWAPRVKPATLQLLMRHRSIETTLKYYVAQDTDDVADELWSWHEAGVKEKNRCSEGDGRGTVSDQAAA